MTSHGPCHVETSGRVYADNRGPDQPAHLLIKSLDIAGCLTESKATDDTLRMLRNRITWAQLFKASLA